MSGTLAAALGSAAGAVALIGAVIAVVCYCKLRNRNTSGTSDTNSSEPSVQAGQNIELYFGRGVSYAPDFQGAFNFTLEELNLATKNFDDANKIGYGMFGEVSKGLLQDGMVVAIKRRQCPPSQEFVDEVRLLSSIRHRNLVSLLGYCQENGYQMLVYEYIPNGSVSTHLYASTQVSSGKLDFKLKLSIAHGAAKGLDHLHCQNPQQLHMNFKTANVLVDEDFIPKVSDAGLRGLIDRVGGPGPSSRTTVDDPFMDLEVKESGSFSVKSDVYSFGVFLLELISGREAKYDQGIIQWGQNYEESSNIAAFIDQRMGSSFTSAGIKELLRLISWCLNPSADRRPPMSFVESELQRIREREIRLTTIMGEGTTTVTLGSQLFTSSK